MNWYRKMEILMKTQKSERLLHRTYQLALYKVCLWKKKTAKIYHFVTLISLWIDPIYIRNK